MLYCATSSDLCFCITWQNGKHETCIFHSNAVLVHCLNSTSCLISSIFFDSRLILTLLYDSLNLVINAFSSGLLGAWFRINEVESAAEVGLAALPAQCTSALPSGFRFLFRKVMQKH